MYKLDCLGYWCTYTKNMHWLDPTQMGETKILVEVDKRGSISMADVVYPWLPSKCDTCGHLGHKLCHCLGIPVQAVRKVPQAISQATCDVHLATNGTSVLQGI